VLRGLDGVVIRVPNSEVAAGSIVNLTSKPLRRSELEVGVAYDTNLQTAAECLIEALGRVERVSAEPPATLARQLSRWRVGSGLLRRFKPGS